MSTRMFFEDPIGNTIFVNTGTEERGIWKRSKEIELELKKPRAQEQFSEAEKKVLDELVKRKHVKTRQIAGKTYYFDLDPKTRTYLTKALRTRV